MCTRTSGTRTATWGDHDRTRFAVNHKRGEWAHDDDGDGVREVHCNTMKGHGVGLWNDLRMFRGVSKSCLDLYVGFDRGFHTFRRDFLGFLQRLLGAFIPNGP